MSDNPNPAGWRSKSVFVNLAEVISVGIADDDDSTTVVTFKNRDGEIRYSLSDAQRKSLVDALETYWSLR